MDLVNEEDAARAETGKQGDELLRLLDEWPHGRVETRMHFTGDETRKRRFPEAGRTVEEEVPQRLAASAGRLDPQRQAGDKSPLADETIESFGAQDGGRETIRF